MSFFADSIISKTQIKVEDYFSPECHNLLKLMTYLYYCYHRDIISTLFPSLAGKVVYDVGCGSGIMSCALFKEAKKIFLLDISETYLEIAKEIYEFNGRDNFVLVKGDISKDFSELGVDEGTVDVIWNHGVIELLDNEKLNSCLKNMSLMLRRGGYAIISTGLFRYFSLLYLPRIIKRLILLNFKEVINFYKSVACKDFYINRLSINHLKDLLRMYNFKIIHLQGFGYMPISMKKFPFEKLLFSIARSRIFSRLHRFSKFHNKLTIWKRLELYFARMQIFVIQKM